MRATQVGDERIRTGPRESGFTLIELLAVILVIGVLVAIAIPVFMSQRESAVDTSMKSDLRNVAMVIENFRTDNEAYPTGWDDIEAIVRTDPDSEFTLDVDGETYCLVVTRAAGAVAGSGPWSYDSDDGGVVADNGPCD